jgi:hypothetical protein
MKLFSSSLFRVASLALALPILGMCDSYTANIYGTSLGLGQSTSGVSSSTVTLSDGDTYSISAPYASSYGSGGTNIAYYPTVTYTSSTPLTAGYDSITVDYFQTFTGAGYFNGLYTESIPLVAGNTVTASGYLEVGGTSLPLISLSGPGSYTGTGSAEITGLPYGSVSEEFSITFDFFDGTVAGTYGSSPSPEPAQMIPAALSLVGFGLVALRRRKQ